MLTEFFTWWTGTLLDMVPQRLSGRDRAGQAALLVAPVPGQPDRVTLATRRGRQGRMQTLGTFDLKPGSPRPPAALLRAARVVLLLPVSAVLGRDLVLPLAAERQMAQVVAYEIDRLTPFAAAELFWTCTVKQRDRARGKLHVQLSLVPRAGLQPLLSALAEAGIVPTTLEAEPGPVRIDMRGERPGRTMAARRIDQGLAGLCAALALAVIAVPFALQARDSGRVEAEIAALRPRVDAAEAARRRIAAASAGVDVIAAARLRLGDTLAVLAAVTDVLPDDTNLTDLTLRDGKLTLAGQSAAAARLIGALSADPLLRNPDFTAPVTRVNEGRTDLFALRAEIVP